MKSSSIFIACVVLVTLASCTKKYSCKCTTTLAQQGYYPIETETTVPVEKRYTKKKAQQTCDNTAVQLRENTKEIIKGPDIGAKCVLKDY
jgi:hypothetical protein